MAKSGYEAQKVSEKIQKQFGDPRAPVVAPSAYQTGAASLPARQAEYARRTEFVPKAYETVGNTEKAQTDIQDNLADFYTKWQIQADELAAKQGQATSQADLDALQTAYGTENKIRSIEFDAFQNAAQRYDALEKAYTDGDAEKELIRSAINGQVRVSDIDAYWDLITNDIKQDLADFTSMTDAEFKAWKEGIAAKAANWGNIVSGLTSLTKVGIDQMDKKDENGLTGWDKLKTLYNSEETQTEPNLYQTPADEFLSTPDSEFLEE